MLEEETVLEEMEQGKKGLRGSHILRSRSCWLVAWHTAGAQ